MGHPDGTESGVYIPRRDTDSRLTVVLGGRAFPGVHSRARFTVAETDDDIRVGLRSMSYFSDPAVFPPGSAEPDCALVMRRVPVRWDALPSLAAG
jgi:hypothetical protein